MEDSIQLYRELLDMSDDIRKYTENLETHELFLSFDDLNEEMFQEVVDLDEPVSKEEIFDRVDGLKSRYHNSLSFYLNSRNNSEKSLDIQLGKKYEEKFMEFLEEKGFNCERGDSEKKKYPDILVKDDEGEKVAYIEFKNLHAPFMKVNDFVEGREWYEGSTTLDYEKAKNQLEIIDDEIDVPVYYTYWIDFPAVKGIFSMEAEDVAELIEEGAAYDREDREGDYTLVQGDKRKQGYTKKIYLPLLQMKTFKQLLEELRNEEDS